MGKINLVIVDKDENYLKGLSLFFSTNYSSEFKIVSITDEAYLEKYLRERPVIDILLINKAMFRQEFRNGFIKTIILLSEEKQRDSFEEAIYKFQPAPKIYGEIKHMFTLKNPEHRESAGGERINTKILSLFSPLGGIGKTALSIAIMYRLSEKNNEVLYLNFEDIPSTRVYFNCDEAMGMSDLLYLAKDRSEVLKDEIVRHLQRDESGIYYFSPINSILDYETINGEDIAFLLNSIRELNMFNYVVLDLSSKFSSNYSAILGLSDKIITPMGSDLNSRVKVDDFLRQQENLDKYQFVINKYREEDETQLIPDEIVKGKKTIIYKLGYYEFLDGRINNLKIFKSSNAFTVSVNQLLQKIL